MTEYRIPKGTPVERIEAEWEKSTTDTWNKVVSTKDVVYTDADLVKKTADGWYVFRLPASAAPYKRVCVREKYVKVVIARSGGMGVTIN